MVNNMVENLGIGHRFLAQHQYWLAISAILEIFDHIL